MHEFSSPETLLDVEFAQPVFVLVDRLAVSPDIRSRLADSIEICYRDGKGEAILVFVPPAATAGLGVRIRAGFAVTAGVEPERLVSLSSTSASSARPAGLSIRSPSRACFRLTIRTAHARAARDSATPSTSTWTWSFQTAESPSMTGSLSRGPNRATEPSGKNSSGLRARAGFRWTRLTGNSPPSNATISWREIRTGTFPA